MSGYSVMLKVEQLPRELRKVAKHWIGEREGDLVPNPHVTIAYFGYLSWENGQKLNNATEQLAMRLRIKNVMFTGQLAIFGHRRDHLVAMVEMSRELINARQWLLLKTRFTISNHWRPHVTLCKGIQFDPERAIPAIRTHYITTDKYVVKIGNEIREY